LAADKLISTLFETAGLIEPDSKIYTAASERNYRGNPPGKAGSLGDRLNWETLLAKVDSDASLYIISNDKDFASSLDPKKLHLFLREEWSTQKEGEVFVHSESESFFSVKFPDIKLATDIEKRVAINDLIASTNFRTTHAATSKLEPYLDLVNENEFSELVRAARENGQIARISMDPDVRALYMTLINARRDRLSETMLSELDELFALNAEQGEATSSL